MQQGFLAVILTALMLVTGCSTVGGAVQGAGEDLDRAGAYIRGIGK